MPSVITNTNAPGKVSHSESAIKRLQRELNELKNRVQNYHEHLDYVEEMYEETKVGINRFKTRAGQQCTIVKKELMREARLLARLTEMNRELKKLEEKDEAPLKTEASDAAKISVKYSTAYQVTRFVKMGCLLVLDSVAAYTLYKVTKPVFFF